MTLPKNLAPNPSKIRPLKGIAPKKRERTTVSCLLPTVRALDKVIATLEQLYGIGFTRPQTLALIIHHATRLPKEHLTHILHHTALARYDYSKHIHSTDKISTRIPVPKRLLERAQSLGFGDSLHKNILANALVLSLATDFILAHAKELIDIQHAQTL